jgi:hypothetical protein
MSITHSLRIVILIAVVAGAAYFLFQKQKKTKEGTRETFALNVDQEYRTAIVKTFNNVLMRDPQEYEVQMYRESMSAPQDTDNMERMLRGSTEFKMIVTKAGTTVTEKDGAVTKLEDASNDLKAAVVLGEAMDTVTASASASSPDQIQTNVDLDKKLLVYRGIVKLYETNLDRLPTMKELDYYTRKINSEKSDFTLVQLEQLLQLSKEYYILQKNQTNRVNANIEGAITDGQVTLIVNDVYNSVFNGAPTREFENFMKIKLVEYSLDTEKLRRLLLLMQAVDSDMAIAVNVDAGTDTSKNDGTASSAKTTTTTTTITTSKEGIAFYDGVDRDPQAKAKAKAKAKANDDDWSVTGSATADADETSGKCPAISFESDHQVWKKNVKCDMSPYSKNKFYDSVYENMKKGYVGAAPDCLPATSTDNERNILAETLANRNQENLETTCSRNSYYLNLEEQMAVGTKPYDKNLQVQYKNTRFGTFLDDAVNTKVGSIMPKFIYQEYQ